MSIKTILSAAAIAAIAGPTFAATQLERSLNVDPGVYSTAELIRLEQAYADDDRQRVDFILSRGGEVVSTSGAGDFGGNLGPIHTNQIVQSALEENDFDRAQHALAGRSDPGNAFQVVKEKIAWEVNADPETNTLAKLIKLQNDRQD